MSTAELAAVLRRVGLRATKPRLAVAQALQAAANPVSHSELVEAVAGKDCDPATVFRNLQKLVEVELAQIASRIGGVDRYAWAVDNHDGHRHAHFACKSCGLVECLPNVTVVTEAADSWQRSVDSSEVQLLGRCPECI